MTIDSAYYIEQYLADDDVTYVFTIESIGNVALEVYTTTAECGGTRVKLVEDTDYTLKFDPYRNPIFKNGKVILTEPLDASLILSIERKTPITNEVLFVAFDEFNSEQFEYALDKICFIEQEIEGSACDCRGVEFPWPPPDPEGPEVPPVLCKTYECDAFITQLNLTASYVWPMDDPTGSNSIAPSSGGITVPQYGTTTYERPSLLADDCVGDFSAENHGLAGWRDSSLPEGSRVPITLSGSSGGLFKLQTAPLLMWRLGFFNVTFQTLALSLESGKVTLVAGGNGPGTVNIEWTGISTSVAHFIFLNYTISENADYNFELFVDFISQGVETGTLADNTFELNADTQINWGGAGNGRLDNQFLFYNPSRLSGGSITTLSDAWDQNQLGYEDPNPNCITPV